MKNGYFIGRLKNALAFTLPQHKVVAPATVGNFSADQQWFVSYIGRPAYKGAYNGHEVVCKRFNSNNQNGWQLNLARGGNGSQFQPTISISDSNVSAYIQIYTNAAFDYGKYYHILGVFGGVSAANWKIYVNGVNQAITLLALGTLTAASNVQTNEKFVIGNYNEATNPFNDPHYYHYGQIASVYIGMGLPSQAEVDWMYRSENSALALTPYLFYQFREKNGLILHDRDEVRSGTLLNYTNAETASAGQPQSGNTAWFNAYTLQPITS